MSTDTENPSEIIRVESYRHKGIRRFNVVLDLNAADYVRFSEGFKFQAGKLVQCPFCRGTKICGPDSIEFRKNLGLPLNPCPDCDATGLYPEKLLQERNPGDPPVINLIQHQMLDPDR